MPDKEVPNQEEGVIKYGVLQKKGDGILGVGVGWKTRYFRLRQGMLEYFSDKNCSSLKGTINLKGITQINLETSNLQLNDQSGRLWQLKAESETEAQSWFQAIEKQLVAKVIHQGWMATRSLILGTWTERFFVLGDRGTLDYYKYSLKEIMIGKIDLESILLISPGSRTQYGRDHTMQIVTKDKNWVLACADAESFGTWISNFERTVPGSKRFKSSHEGSLLKTGKIISSLKPRYFALCKTWLFYFVSVKQCLKFKSIIFFNEKTFNRAFRLYVQGAIELRGADIEEVKREELVFGFNIQTPTRKYELAAFSEEERETWMEVLTPICNNVEKEPSQPSEVLILGKVEDEFEAKVDWQTDYLKQIMEDEQPLNADRNLSEEVDICL